MQLAVVRAPPERDDGRMLEEDDCLRDRTLRDRPRERPLQVPRLAVRDEPELEQVAAGAHAVSLAADKSRSAPAKNTRV